MTKIVGILNITPDSFSDGGKFLDVKAALQQVEIMLAQGADVIDIGAQSTRPQAETISHEEEWFRLEPVLKEIRSSASKVEISIDSFYPQTIRKALDYNISIINDVTGFYSSEMKKLAAETGKKIIFMHSLTIPVDKNINLPEYTDVINFLKDWAEKKTRELEYNGIKKDKLIFDPGIGFGKTPKQSLQIALHAEKFNDLGVEVMIGHSEKSFMSLFTENQAGKRNVETHIFSYLLARKKVNYLRVHDVEGNKRAVNLAKYLL